MSIASRLGLKGAPIYLMDGTAFLFRSFYASGNMQSASGHPTGAIYILGRLLLKILKSEQPAYFAFILDGKGPHFRHEIYKEYKAQRSPTPEDLVAQIDPVKQMVESMGLHLTVSENCEADDCIASLAKRFQNEHPVVIIGADKDLKQCIGPNVVLWDPASKDEKITTLELFEKETGLTPAQWPDFQAVIGDSSDNIPGVPGVGPKTAAKVFADFPTLEQIKDNLEKLPEKLREKFKNSMQDAFTYRELTRLSTDCCGKLGLADLEPAPPNLNNLAELFEKFELFSLMGPVKQLASRMGDTASSRAKENTPAPEVAIPPASGESRAVAKPNASRQMSLFCPTVTDAPGADSPNLADPFAQLEAPPARMISLDELPDLEGTQVSVLLQDRLWHIGVEGKAYTVEASGSGVELPDLVSKLNQAACVITPDVKTLLLSANAWQLIERWFDLGLAAYLLNPEERDYAWPHLAARQAYYAKISPKAPALLALAIWEMFMPKLKNAGLTGLMQDLELPLIPVLAQMQKRGISLDLKAFKIFLKEVQEELEHLTSKVYAQAGGEEFNIRSSHQLQEVLFEKLGLPKAGKTKGGALSTSQEALEKLAGKHEIIDTILDFRKLEKMRSTYLEPFPQLVDETGRIHTSFNQLATATGRLSSSNPNLQNIPIRGELGSRMRSCFVASPGKLLISADYSQIELRVLAHLSQDPALLDAFRNGEDIHRSTASLLFEKPQEEITPEERRNAKTINFGIIYGMGAQKLARELKISMNEAKDFITRYYEKLSTLKGYYDGIINKATQDGFVTTMAGRRRFIADINSANAQALSQAKRQAVNTVIQGSAADIIKIAMLSVSNDASLTSLGARLILQVHDELVLEAPVSTAGEVGERLADIMSKVNVKGTTLSVPLLVDWGMAENWDAAH